MGKRWVSLQINFVFRRRGFDSWEVLTLYEERERKKKKNWRWGIFGGKKEQKRRSRGLFAFFRGGKIFEMECRRGSHTRKRKKTCCRPRCAINVSGISGVDWKWSVSFWLAWPIQKFWKYAKTTVTLIVEIFKVLLKKSEYARCELPPTKLGIFSEHAW